jgi:hypothetical protein
MATESSPPLAPLPSPHHCPPRSFHPLPSALCSPLLSPFLSSRPTWILTETDARSAVVGCQEGFVGPCSHLGPLPHPAFLSAALVDRLLRRVLPVPLLHQPVRGDLPEGQTSPAEGDARGNDKLRHAGRLWRRGHGDEPLQWGRATRVQQGGSCHPPPLEPAWQETQRGALSGGTWALSPHPLSPLSPHHQGGKG